MNLLFSAWNFAGIPVPKPTAQESAALIMLAASLLVYRTFRERYLILWILGWVAYLASHLPLPGVDTHSPAMVAAGQAEFVLAVCLFAAAVFVYTHAKKLALPLAIIACVLVAYAIVRGLMMPDDLVPRVALEVAYRVIAVAAAVQLIRTRWGRWEFGTWM